MKFIKNINSKILFYENIFFSCSTYLNSFLFFRKKERISIAKTDIKEIRKDKTAIAIIATSGGIAAATVLIVEISKSTDDLADTAAAFGSGLN